MTREEAILILEEEAEFLYGGDEPYNKIAFDMAIEALKADALLKQEIDFHKEVSRIEAEKVVDLEHKLADTVSVVRCKDCRYQKINRKSGTANCGHIHGMITADDDNFCSYGIRREEVNGFKSVGQAWNTSQERGE